MTLEQTRQLGIEFERRVQTMIPETEFAAKLHTVHTDLLHHLPSAQTSP